MTTVVGDLAGAIWGAYFANKRGGNRFDIAQYTASSSIAFGLLAMFLSILQPLSSRPWKGILIKRLKFRLTLHKGDTVILRQRTLNELRR